MDEFAKALADAMSKEFGTFLGADPETWEKAARGVIKKMGLKSVHGESRSERLGFQDYRLHRGKAKK